MRGAWFPDPHLSLRILRQAAVGEGGREIVLGGAVTEKISALQSAISHLGVCQNSLMQLWVPRRKTKT